MSTRHFRINLRNLKLGGLLVVWLGFGSAGCTEHPSDSAKKTVEMYAEHPAVKPYFQDDSDNPPDPGHLPAQANNR